MSKIKAFKAVVYNPEKVDFNQVVCPPYDVISTASQDAYHKRSPFNLIHILLGKDIPQQDKYHRSGEIFRNWLKEKILIQDNLPSIYFYSQQYTILGEKKTRLGFISLLKLGNKDGSDAAVFGHENTHLEAKNDRFKLMKQVKANLSPIFVVFLDKKRIIQRVFQKLATQKVFIEVKDVDNTVHKIWKVDAPDMVALIESSMDKESMFIADGHHRYEVACAYRDLMLEKSTKLDNAEDFNYVLTYFTNTDGRGLSILPIHRLLKLDTKLNLDEFILKVKENFDVDQVKDKTRFLFLMAKAAGTEHLIGAYIQNKYFLLRLKNVKTLDKLIADRPKEYRTLDVSILNYLVFQNILKMDLNNLKNIKYSPEPAELIPEVDADPLKIAFFLNPVKMEQIIDVALGGNKMPPKSTYFYPKVLSGLVINKFGKE
ncbi:MAG: DUF1015 domain-containing protein [Candidatus Omnitrophica bacterium]|nr:DUF1015 domain-containing protein [Candidatus Omnitrophota bacterium]